VIEFTSMVAFFFSISAVVLYMTTVRSLFKNKWVKLLKIVA
jgi:hypothetical protein